VLGTILRTPALKLRLFHTFTVTALQVPMHLSLGPLPSHPNPYTRPLAIIALVHFNRNRNRNRNRTCRDWMGNYTGKSSLGLKPTSTDEVSQILAYCSLRRLALVPQGGNTGLVGGSVPVFDEVVLNMSAMNKILSFDEVGGLVRSRV
jgi:hypothetical protein